MKNNQLTTTILTILTILLVSFLFIKNCTQNFTTVIDDKPTVKITTEYVEINTKDTLYVPKIKKVIEHDSFYYPVDTLAILKDYYRKYVYIDTIYIDTFGYSIVEDTVTQNKITSRILNNNIKIPIVTIEKTYYLNKNELYFGPSLSTDLNIHFNMLYKTKNKTAYLVGIGLNNNVEPTLKAGMLWKFNK
jgi:hypothetical protein